MTGHDMTDQPAGVEPAVVWDALRATVTEAGDPATPVG
jgi:hypothetical protein